MNVQCNIYLKIINVYIGEDFEYLFESKLHIYCHMLFVVILMINYKSWLVYFDTRGTKEL